MRFIKLLLLFLLPLLGDAQSGNQLIRIHTVTNTTDMNAISSPSEGNLVYVQSNDQIYFYDGSAWQSLSSGSSGSGWGLNGNSITSSNFLGSTNNQDVKIRTNNTERMVVKNDGKVGIGTSSPSGIFQVNSPNSSSPDYSGTVSASSVYQWYNIDDGWDNHVIQGWGSVEIPSAQLPSDGMRTEWFKVDYGTPKEAVGYEFIVSGFGQATKWEFQGSNDDATWVTLDAQDVGDIHWSILAFGQQTDSIAYYFNNTTAYRYYRWVFQRLNRHSPPSANTYTSFYNYGDFDIFISNGADFIVTTNGRVGIGTDNPSEKLHVIGNILATGTITTPDYVFEHYFEGKSELKPDYQLKPLAQTINFAKTHKHLPGIPSAKDVEEKGGIILNNAVEQNLEKIEELHIYIYQLTQEVERLNKMLNEE